MVIGRLVRKRHVLGGLLAVLPAVLVCILVWATCRCSLLDFEPYYSDELAYWHETLTFASVGFSGGNYTAEEQLPVVSRVGFGPHGPVFPVLYGSVGRVFGWHPNSAVILNVILLGLSLFFLVSHLRLGIGRTLLVGALVACSWGVLLLLPTNMQEGLHFALAVLLATAFVGLIQQCPTAARARKWTTFALIAVASLLRPTWGVLFFPYFLLIGDRTAFNRIVPQLLKASLVSLVTLGIWAALAAPYPTGFVASLARDVSISPSLAVQSLLQHALENLSRLVHPSGAELLEITQRYQVLAMAGFLGVVLLHSRIMRWLRTGVFSTAGTSAAVPSVLFFLVAVLGLTILLYDVRGWRDYRVLAPCLLFVLLVIVIEGNQIWRRGVIALIIVSNLAFAPQFVSAFGEYRTPNFVRDGVTRRDVQMLLGSSVEFERRRDAWCNTILLSLTAYTSDIILPIPAGIGVSVILDAERVPVPPKSKYLLLSDQDHVILHEGVNLRLLQSLGQHKLYLNLDSGCVPDG